MHLLVDSTGLKLCGAGEWLHEKHGTKTRRAWRTLHIGTDADTGHIVAATLTGSDACDASQVGPVLDQMAGPVASFIADGAYDQDGVYDEVATRQPDAAVGRATTVQCRAERRGRDRPDATRPSPAADRGTRPHGLADGLRLQLARPCRVRRQPI